MLLILTLLTVYPRLAMGEDGNSGFTNGEQPLYIFKQVVKTTSPFVSIQWKEGPSLLVINEEITEAADPSRLDHYALWDNPIYSLNIGNPDSPKQVTFETTFLAAKNGSNIQLTVGKRPEGTSELVIYYYDGETHTYVEAERVSHAEGDGDDKPLRVDLAAIYLKPPAKADVQRAVKTLRGMVMAFYYQWYQTPEGPSGSLLHWNPVNDNIPPYTDHPLMGLYDSPDENVIRAHFAMAKQAGIDVLIADYAYVTSYDSRTWPLMRDLALEYGLKLTYYGCSSKDLDRIKEDIKHPAFLKDEGKPVFFFYDTGRATPAQWLEYRKSVEAALGPCIWIAQYDADFLGVFDGFHNYIYMTDQPGDTGEIYYTSSLNLLKSGPHEMLLDEAISLALSGGVVPIDIKANSVTVVPGYDDTHVRTPGQVMVREDGAFYRRLWGTAMSLDADYVLITSWNEWHEGTEIEPSGEYGFHYLELTSELASAYKGENPPPMVADYSAQVDNLTQRPDKTGQGVVHITAEGSTAVYVKVGLKGQSLTAMNLSGSFYTYLEESGPSSCSVIIPSIEQGGYLDVGFTYTGSTIRPPLTINVSAYDPAGGFHTLYSGQVTPRLESAITCRVQPSATFGESVLVEGALSPGKAGEQVKLRYTKPDSTTVERIAQTEADGAYKDSFTPDTIGIWGVNSSWAGDTEFAKSESSTPVFIVNKVKSKITLYPPPDGLVIGDTITMTGELIPAVTGAELTLTYSRPNHSILVRPATTMDRGVFHDSLTLDAAGDWDVSAYWEGDDINAASTSQVTVFIVQRKASEVTIEVSPLEIVSEDQVTVRGRIVPDPGGAKISLVYKKPDGSQIERIVDVAGGGSFQDSVSVKETGDWTIKARWDGDSALLPSESTIGSFKVKGKPIGVNPTVTMITTVLGVAVSIYYIKRRMLRYTR